MSDYDDQIEQLSYALIDFDSLDQTLHQELHHSFVTISENLHNEGQDQLASYVEICAEKLNSEIKNASVSESMQKLMHETVSLLQQVLQEQRPLAELPIPQELAVDVEGVFLNEHATELSIDLLNDFNSEALEMLASAEESFLNLDQADFSTEQINSIFRAFHTIKGGASLVSLDEIVPLAHSMESLLDQYRSNEQSLPSEVIEIGLKSIDLLRDYTDFVALNGSETEHSDQQNLISEMVDEINRFDTSSDAKQSELLNPLVDKEPTIMNEELNENELSSKDESVETVGEESEMSMDDLSHISMDPEMMTMFVSESTEHLETAEPHFLTLEDDPHDADAIDAIFRSFHTVKGTAGFMELHDISKLAHEAENMLDQARDGKLEISGIALDLSLESLDLLKKQVSDISSAVANGESLQKDPEINVLIKKIEAFLADGHIDSVKSTSTQTTTSQTPQKTETTQVDDANVDETSSIEDKPQLKPESKSLVKKAKKTLAVAETVKVDRDRLDELIDLIGELVIAESMVYDDMESTSKDTQSSSRKLGQLRKITRELQELSLSLRMVPIKGLFQKMARLTRDLSKKMNKSIEFMMEGQETEMDKTIVDQVADPLVHIIRNSLDHGIEPSEEERTAAGKPAKAKVTIRAFHQGGNIYIELQDDGRGLNRERILAKAIENGMIKEDHQLTDKEIYNLIFQAGFSTAAQVTDVSGRGVGMDVVRKNIDSLRGSVDVDSTPGEGTTISMRLPLTLAIIDGMVVRVGENRFIIPTLGIIEQIRPNEEDLGTVGQRGEIINVRGKNVPFYRMDDLFFGAGRSTDVTDAIVVLVDDKDHMAGLMVDEVIGQQQVVIKAFGETLEGLPGLAGGAVLPDGEVGIILDIHGVLKHVRNNNRQVLRVEETLNTSNEQSELLALS